MSILCGTGPECRFVKRRLAEGDLSLVFCKDRLRAAKGRAVGEEEERLCCARR